MLEIREEHDGKVLSVQVRGKLVKDDYIRFVPVLERAIKEHGKIRLLFEMRDFHGWSAGAMWEDLKFDLKHFGDIERLAIIGETRWQRGMSVFCKPFTTARIHYFTHDEIEPAREWLEQDLHVKT